MTSVKLPKFVVDVHYGRRDITPQEAYDHLNSPVEILERRSRTRPKYKALQESSVGALDGIVAKYDLRINQPLNSQTSTPGKEVSDIVYHHEQKICDMLVRPPW